MATWRIKTEQDRETAIKVLRNRAMPCTMELTKGLKRSNDQNKLSRKWYKELEDQGDQTAEEYRGFCKLHFGVVLAKQQSDLFAEKYDRIVKPLPYEQKLELMMTPLDFPVSRILNTANESKYLDKIYLYYTQNGFKLTNPDRKGMPDTEY